MGVHNPHQVFVSVKLYTLGGRVGCGGFFDVGVWAPVWRGGLYFYDGHLLRHWFFRCRRRNAVVDVGAGGSRPYGLWLA
jgi:hypothetical protein